MNGRLEHDLKVKRQIEGILAKMPDIVTSYYYNISISSEPTTCYAYLKTISHFYNFMNEHGFSKIDEVVIGKYFESIRYVTDSKGSVKKSSDAYMQKSWSSLNSYFKYLAQKRLIESNPLDLMKRPQNHDNVKRVALTEKDLRRLYWYVKYEAWRDHKYSHDYNMKYRDIFIMYLFITTGMRRTALTQINIEDFDFEEGFLRVRDKRNRVHIYNVTEEAVELYNKWMPYRTKILAGKKEDALFISKFKSRINDQGVEDIVKKYSQRALGKELSPHKLRAAFVTNYYEASGGDLEATREAVGHSNISVTSRYIVRENDSRKEAINYMTNMITN